MTDFKHTAALGAGVIGASWTALFLASGRSVSVYDPSDTAEKTVRDYIEMAWPTLEELGLAADGNADAVTFHKSAVDALHRCLVGGKICYCPYCFRGNNETIRMFCFI